MQTTTILSNLDTEYTIDMYQTFTGDDTDTMLVDDYNEQNDTDLQYDDFDWTYNTNAVCEGLAHASIDYIYTTLPNNDIIQSITFDSICRPMYYNYTTDSYNMAITYNPTTLESLPQNIKDIAIERMTKDKGYINIPDTGVPDIDTQEWHDYLLLAYIDSIYTVNSDDYISTMFEQASGLYYESTVMKLIDTDTN